MSCVLLQHLSPSLTFHCLRQLLFDSLSLSHLRSHPPGSRDHKSSARGEGEHGQSTTAHSKPQISQKNYKKLIKDFYFARASLPVKTEDIIRLGNPSSPSNSSSPSNPSNPDSFMICESIWCAWCYMLSVLYMYIYNIGLTFELLLKTYVNPHSDSLHHHNNPYNLDNSDNPDRYPSP